VRNRDLRQALYGYTKPVSPEESRRRCARVSRMLRKLWAHGLIYRVRNARLYRVTRRGYRIMSSVLVFHKEEFADAYARAS
jgi:DNA-binding MarR family transcriptional regulator